MMQRTAWAAWAAFVPLVSLVSFGACGGRALSRSDEGPNVAAGSSSAGSRGDDESPPLPAGAAGSAGPGGGDAGAAGRDSSDGGAPSTGGASAAGADQGGAPPLFTRTLVDEPTQPRGLLSAIQYAAEGSATTAYDVEAMFQIRRGRWDGCTRVQLGDCWYYDCPPGSAPYQPSAPLIDVGALSLVTSGTAPKQIDVGLLYDFFYQADGASELWSTPAQAQTFSATGSVATHAPAFAVTAQSPPSVSLQTLDGQPAPPMGMSITRSKGAQMRWSSSGPGRARFTLLAFQGQSFAAECDFDASARAGTVPAPILQAFEPGSDYRLVLRGSSSASGVVSGWALEALLSGFAGPLSAFEPPTVQLR